MRQRHYRDLISYRSILCKLCKQSLVKQGIKMMEILHLSETTTDTSSGFYYEKNPKPSTNRLSFHSLYYLLEGRLQKTFRGSEFIR